MESEHRPQTAPGVAAGRELQGILDLFPDATFAVDRNGEVIAWNSAIEELTGVPRSQAFGSSGYTYAIPFFGEPRPLLINLALEQTTGHAHRYISLKRQGHALSAEEFAPKLFDGRGAYVRATAFPLFDADGARVGAIEFIRDITGCKLLESKLRETERLLQEKTQQMEEAATALKVLLNRSEQDRKEIAENIMTNLRESVLHYVEKLGKTALDKNQKMCLATIEATVLDVLSPFLRNISARYTSLTPMEVQVANLIKAGKTTKEIAQFLHVAEKTVSTHRYNLRMKLGLKNRKVNLRSHLASL